MCESQKLSNQLIALIRKSVIRQIVTTLSVFEGEVL